MTLRPTLAATGGVTVDSPYIRLPSYLSPKLDGFRVLVEKENSLLSRKLIQIPNRFTRARFGRKELAGLDGELIVGSPVDKQVFNVSASALRTEDGEPDATLYVFDTFLYPREPYTKRLEIIKEIAARYPENIKVVVQHYIESRDEIAPFEEKVVGMGFEGVIVRYANSPYKFGRSTEQEGYLLKIKRWTDAEALVLKVLQGKTNMNAAMVDALGYTKRSSAKSGKKLLETAGAYLVRDLKSGVEFKCNIGPGVTQKERDEIWKNRADIEGKMVVTYKYVGYGMKDKPKWAQALRFRPAFDVEAA